MSDNQKLGIILSGVGVLIVIALIVFLVARDGGGGSEEAGGEIFLEPIASEGDDPFTSSVSNPDNSEPDMEPADGDQDDDATLELSSSSGAEPGLYGGTRDQSSCDRGQLVAFLEDNSDKASAWAGVLDISQSDIPDYIDGLTPVQLRADTRMTNHGFRNGRATVIQTVLQAGTAVLVDDFGVPRVRCACGNPLIEPVAAQRAPTYRGDPWPAYSPANVTVIQQVTVINVITIVDIDTGEEFDRPVGTDGLDDTDVGGGTDTTIIEDDFDADLGTGDVQVTLRWTGSADIDPCHRPVRLRDLLRRSRITERRDTRLRRHPRSLRDGQPRRERVLARRWSAVRHLLGLRAEPRLGDDVLHADHQGRRRGGRRDLGQHPRQRQQRDRHLRGLIFDA